MDREDEKNNLFKILLLRNQNNCQIIRRYRRKSINYLNNTHEHTSRMGSNQPSERQHLSSENLPSLAVANVSHACSGEASTVEKNNIPIELSSIIEKIEPCQNFQNQNKQASGNLAKLHSPREKCSVKLPSISNCFPGTFDKREHQINTKPQLSISTASALPLDFANRNNEKTEPCRYNSPSISIDQGLNRPTLKQESKQSIQAITKGICGTGNTIHEKENYSSHKALINMQEITFMGHSKKKREKINTSLQAHKQPLRFRANREIDKIKSKGKMGKILLRKSQKESSCFEAHNSLDEDAKKAVMKQAGRTQTSEPEFQSISISALCYIKAAIARQEAQTIPTVTISSQLDSQTTIKRHNQNIPQINRIKQLKFNLHKARKQLATTTTTTTTNPGTLSTTTLQLSPPPIPQKPQNQTSVSTTATNQSINTINNNTNNNLYSHNSCYNHTYKHSSVPELMKIPELGTSVFRVQAIPVHHIRWI